MNHRHQVFITQMLLHGDKEEAYACAFPKARGRSITEGANRLMADPDIKKVLEQSHANIRKKLEKEIVEKQKEELLSVNKMKELLSQMAEGMLETPKHLRTKEGGWDVVQTKPNHWHILQAISAYCRLTGQYKKAESDALHPPKESVEEIGRRLFYGLTMDEYSERHGMLDEEYIDPEDDADGRLPRLLPKEPYDRERFYMYQKQRADKRDALRVNMTAEEIKAEAVALKEFERRPADNSYLPADEVREMLWQKYLHGKGDENLKGYRALFKMLGVGYLPQRYRWQAENEAGWEFHPHDPQLIRKKGGPISTIFYNKIQEKAA